MTDWQRWHDPYDDLSSELSHRLAAVEGRLYAWADAQPPGPLRILSICAGQGRDVVGAFRDHDRSPDLSGLLVDLVPQNVEAANAALRDAGLDQVRAVVGDAGCTTAFADAVPANLLLVCGVFGNISESDVRRTVKALPTLCADGATVVWTRHRRDPDLTPAILRWFTAAGFDEVDFDSPGPDRFAVATHRLTVTPRSYVPELSLFVFQR